MSGVAKDLNELKLSHTNSGGLKCYSRFEKTCMHGFLLGLKGHIPHVTRVPHSGGGSTD